VSDSGAFDGPLPAPQRYFVLGTVTLATMLGAMSSTIAYAVLPQMQGSLSATQDQIAWSVTFNLMAMAIGTPTTGWLSNRFGRRHVFLVSVTGFSVATFLCGAAESLETLVIYRVLQGLFVAPIVPLSQAIILGVFPTHQRGLATAIWGMGVVMGPIFGPTIGGYVAEAYNWRWTFFMIMPVCVLSVFLGWVFITDRRRLRGTRMDWIGFVALTVAIACFQLIMDRGARLDWYESGEIIVETFLAVAAFYIFLVHSFTAAQPFLPPQLLKDRNFALGLCFALVFGALSFVPLALLPPLLQNLRGFPDSLIGTVLAARGFGSLMGNFAVVAMGRFDPRISLAIGFICQGTSGLFMAQFDLNVSIWDAMWTSAFQGFGNSFLWVPLTILAYATLHPRQMGEATAVFHLLRNLGSAIFISICVGVAVHYASVNYTVMSEVVTPFNEIFRFPSLSGAWRVDDLPGLAQMSGEVTRQAAMVGYVNAFYVFSAVALSVVPFIWILKRPPPR
jgi:MFS transporter, DHA2 family, multidrug resistance protein